VDKSSPPDLAIIMKTLAAATFFRRGGRRSGRASKYRPDGSETDVRSASPAAIIGPRLDFAAVTED